MGLQGFHQQNEGVNFRQAFRWGLTGPYERFIEVCWEGIAVACWMRGMCILGV